MNPLDYLKVPTVMVDGLPISALGLLLYVGILILAFLSLRAPGLQSKVMALALVPVSVALLAVSLTEQLSHPKELSFQWLKLQGKNSLSVHEAILQPPKAIHLWLSIDGEPRSFFIAWNEELEKTLLEAKKRLRAGDGGDLQLRWDDKSFTFDVEPWPAPAPKSVEPDTVQPRRFEQDA